jgi:hypothetical protein
MFGTHSLPQTHHHMPFSQMDCTIKMHIRHGYRRRHSASAQPRSVELAGEGSRMCREALTPLCVEAENVRSCRTTRRFSTIYSHGISFLHTCQFLIHVNTTLVSRAAALYCTYRRAACSGARLNRHRMMRRVHRVHMRD